MNVKILHLIEGAKQAKGLTVIIDVFRAFSVEAYLLANGAEKIIPVGEAELAYELKRKNGDMLLVGERRGKILPGFDCGNSPSQLKGFNPKGRTVIHTTSAGTQGIANAIYADEILGCSLLNARATAEYIRKSGAKYVSLVCMGLDGISRTEEDDLCAYYIKSILDGTKLDVKEEIEKLKFTSGAKFFDKSQSDVFPEEDFHMCTIPDKFNFVLKLEKSDNGLDYMVKVVV